MAAAWIALHLTDRCQLDCKHCLRDPEQKPTIPRPADISRPPQLGGENVLSLYGQNLHGPSNLRRAEAEACAQQTEQSTTKPDHRPN